MKSTLMVYYTFEGNTGYVAELIRSSSGIETEPLKVDKEPPRYGFGKIFLGGKSAIFQEDPVLHPLKADIDSYENIIIAFPVWAGTYPPAIGSFLKRCPIKDKTIYIIACSGSGRAEKAVNNIKKRLSDNRFAGELSLVEPLKNRERTQKQISLFLSNMEKAQAE
ncbi:MAG: NAD(P)H-dependent oxidoreductase [Oscillospiraceae bacterium]|nr:NAD(P)H-dependent oxidoreductase [Oscillospiraceae bacterium]